jgi:membrane fusion protein, multidrug efflux system
MKHSVKNFIVYPIAVLVFAGLAAGTYVYKQYADEQNRKKEHAAVEQARLDAIKQIPKVKVVEVFPVPFTDYLILPGTVKPFADIDLAAKMGGTVKTLGVREGQRVEKGAKLLELDIKAVSSKVTEVRVRYEQARKDYERVKQLYDDNISSKSQLDNAKTALDAAKSGLNSVALNVDDGTLLAPITGILDRVNVDVGENINIGQQVMKIVDIDQVIVELPIPEKDILYFTVGQDVQIVLERSNNETFEFPGTIDFVSMTADQANRTYLIKVLVQNPDLRLRPGMIARAQLVRRKIPDAIVVPFFTIIDREDGKGVFVIDGDVAKAHTVQYGVFQRGLVEITSGLKVGEKLVVVGQRGLIDGAKVEVTADVTALTKLWLSQGKELSDIPAELLQ